MTSRFHIAVVATIVAAAIAIGFASVATVAQEPVVIAKKTDRLPVSAAPGGYLTVEARSDGISVLSRVPLD